mgnify:CR=1 FL=1
MRTSRTARSAAIWAALAAGWLGGAVGAQETAVPVSAAVAADPTQADVRMQDSLKAQLDAVRAVELKGAVIAGDRGGVALLAAPERAPVLVRADSQFVVTIAGLPLKVVVKDVAPGGVEIEAPSLGKAVHLATLLGAGAPPAAPVRGALRHVEFHDVPLADALRMLAEQSGNNYSCSAAAGQTPVSVSLRWVSAQTAVEELCKTHGLWFRRDEQSGIVRVMTMAEFERDLVSFHEEKDEVFTLLYPNVLEVAAAIRDLYGDRVRLSLGRAPDDESDDLQSRFERFDLIDSRSSGLSELEGLAGAEGSRTTVISGDSGVVWTSNGAAATNSAAGRFRDLTPAMAEKVQQALAAGTSTNGADPMVAAYQDQPANIFVTVSRRNNMIIVRTSDEHALTAIRELIRRLDVPTPTVLLEVKILSLDLDDGFQSNFDYQFGGVVSGGGTAAQTLGGFTSGEIAPAAGTMTPGGTGLQSGTMTFQVVNEYFRARMQLLESKGRVKTLATPMLLTANNEVSRLFLGEERPRVRDISSQTITMDNASAIAPDTDFDYVPVGTTLLLTPNINSDRTVTLRMLQENSSIATGGATVPVVVTSSNQTSVQNVPIDVVSSRSISGTFVAKDNMAVAVGGLIQETVSNEREQVPLLGKIPVLGALFRRTTTSKSRQELIVMVRPHIINTPSEGESISRELLKDLSIHPAAPEAKPSLGTFKEEKNQLKDRTGDEVLW